MIAPQQPQYPGGQTPATVQTNPSDFDPELQTLEILKGLLKGMDTPSDISKNFAARKALYTALNHREPTYDKDGKMIDLGNPTGYDASLRIALYKCYEMSSLNIMARLFGTVTSILMKPKVIIQGIPSGANPQEEPGFLSRAWGRLTGKGQPAQTNGQAQQ